MSWLSNAVSSVSNAVVTVAEAAVSVVEVVGTVVEGAIDVVADILDNGVDAGADAVESLVDSGVTWVSETAGPLLGGAANVIGGLVNGVVEGVKDLAHDYLSIVKDLGSIIGSILRLDFGGVVRGFVDLVIDIADLFLDAGRFVSFGYFVGGIVHQFERESLRTFVKDLLEATFGQDPALLARIQAKLNLATSDWGLSMTSRHRVFMLDSANTNLVDWHNDRTLDLYALAGVLSFHSLQVQRPRTWVCVVGEDGMDSIFPITRWAIKDYLESRGERIRLRVYAMDSQAVSERLDVAVDKCRKLGVRLSWDQGTAFYSPMFPAHEITACSPPTLEKSEYQFQFSRQETFVVDHKLRTGDRFEECSLLALGAFELGRRNGQAAGRQSPANNQPCPTVGRDDGCCLTIPESDATSPTGSSVVHVDGWPSHLLRYVLAHEIGHYLGLDHGGHHGFQNIMYTMDETEGLNLLDWGLFKFYYQSEPEFTLSDGKNVWRFIVNQMPCCLDDALTCAGGRIEPEVGTHRFID